VSFTDKRGKKAIVGNTVTGLGPGGENLNNKSDPNRDFIIPDARLAYTWGR